MKPNLDLSIPKPCAEKWQNFMPTALGGYCSSCSKVVVDFTKMTDQEILDFFENKPAHACGRFRPDQLKTYQRQPSQISIGLGPLRAGILGLLLLLVSKQTYSQEITKAKIETVQLPDEWMETKPEVSTEYVIRGIVIDNDGLPLPGCNVYLKGGVEGTVTDAEGRFEFPSKLKEGDRLIFSFIGFKSQEYVVKKEDNTGVEVSMVVEVTMSCDYLVLGEVAIDDVYSTKTGLRLWWSNFKKLF